MAEPSDRPTPIIAGTRSKMYLLDPGVYRWCACGRSKDQPWCDDSHVGTGIEPVTFTLTERRRVTLCMCKHSTNQPFCNGQHQQFHD